VKEESSPYMLGGPGAKVQVACYSRVIIARVVVTAIRHTAVRKLSTPRNYI
jgi:hypothetical protein